MAFTNTVSRSGGGLTDTGLAVKSNGRFDTDWVSFEDDTPMTPPPADMTT